MRIDISTPPTEIEWKKHKTTICQRTSPTHSPPMIPKFMQEFAVMVCDIILILECSKGALKRMLITFEQMVLPMNSETYTALIKSEEYRNVRSVRALFQLLGPYWKPVDCSLLEMLVEATMCMEAIDRLRKYLSNRNTAGTNVVLGEEDDSTHVTLSDSAATCGDYPVTPKVQDSLPKESPPTKIPVTTTSASSASNHSTSQSNGFGSPYHSVSPDQSLESDVVISQPKAEDNDSLQISAKVAQERVTWAEYNGKTSLLCGLLRLPRFMLQYKGVEPGCVTIKWITSKGLLPYILSVILDDGDLQLLLQENIVSIHVGAEYTIKVGSQKYWMVRVQCQFVSCVHNIFTPSTFMSLQVEKYCF